MESLFEGTSRLAQMALCLLVGAIVITTCSAVVTGTAKIGPALMVVAGGMALFSYMRDREDYGMWPAYVTFGAALVGVIVCIPLMLNTSGMRAIADDGKLAQADFAPTRTAIDQAFNVCARTGPNNSCTALTLASTPMAGPANVKAASNCTDISSICVNDVSSGGFTFEYITRLVRSVGSLRIIETRSQQGKVLSTACGALDPKADGKQVKAACGVGVGIVAAPGS